MRASRFWMLLALAAAPACATGQGVSGAAPASFVRADTIALSRTLDSLHMCERIPNLDLRFFVTSVNIQRQTGGDLAEILDRIGHVIRERFKILGQVKALTAEGRLSGVVLIAMPIGLFLMMLHMKPDYISLLWTDEMGIKMSVGAIILMIIGSYAIKKIVDIKV